MAKQTINIGTSANDGTGSTLREAFDITNDNFTELYDGTGGLLHKIEGTNFTGSLLIGHSSTGTLSNAQNNVGIGISALGALTSGDHNVAIGKSAGISINSGSGNITIGYETGDAITTGVDNIAIGRSALSTEDGHGRNIAIGRNALSNQNAGNDAYNIAIGYTTGQAITTGNRQVLIGGLAAASTTTGARNVAIGYRSLNTNVDGFGATALGYEALLAQEPSGQQYTYNVAIGYEAGHDVSTGLNNTIIGGKAGDTLTSGNNNTIIGYSAAASAVDVSNEVTIGNSSVANVRIPSDSTLKIGADGDLQIEHVSSNSFIKNTAVGDLYIENQVDDASIIFRCDDGSGGLDTYFSIVGAGNRVQYNKNLRFVDNVVLSFGSDDDLQIQHNSGASLNQIDNLNGDFYIQQNANDKDIIFRCDDGSGGLTTYLFLDGSSTQVKYDVNLKIHDDKKLIVGDGDDLQIYHNGTNSHIDNNAGNLNIRQFLDDGDITFNCDDGSGGVTEYFRLDGGVEEIIVSKKMQFNDSVKAVFGTGEDLDISHDGTDSTIDNAVGDLIISNNADDKDIVFKSDNGSGGLSTYLRLDGSDTLMQAGVNLRFSDNVKGTFGNSDDLTIHHSGTNSFIKCVTNNLIIENTADDANIQFKCDDGSGGTTTYMTIDGSATKVTLQKDLRANDGVKIQVGSSGDLFMVHESNTGKITNGTGDLEIIQNTDDGDIIFKSDDNSGGITEYLRLDGGDKTTVVSQPFRFQDSIKAKFGTGSDLRIDHDGTDSNFENYTGDLRFRQFADDKDIIFQCDDGSGGTTEYFRLDGGTTSMVASKNITFLDGLRATFGGGADMQIYHNSTNTIIENNTGDLYIANSADDRDIIFQSDDGSGGVTTYFKLDGSTVTTVASKQFKFEDDVKLFFGTGADSALYASSDNLIIEQTTDDKDIKFMCDDGSGGTEIYINVDGSARATKFDRPTFHNDNIKGRFGNSGDLEIYHNGTNNLIDSVFGDISIRQLENDKDIRLRCDDGSGGETDYILLDGSEVSTKILTQKVIMSNLPTSDPSNAGQLYNDSGVLKVSAG